MATLMTPHVLGGAPWSVLWWPGIATGLVAMLLAWAVARFLVPGLPEPEPDTDDEFVKPTYRSLRHPRMIVPSMLLALAAGVLAPASGTLIWSTVALAGCGAALVVVDALTTYLPMRLHLLTSALMALGAIIGVTLLAPERWLPVLVGAVCGALASHALFWLIWRWGQGFGYGDVRLAALLGGWAGAQGVQMWWQSLFAGVVVGAIVGVTMAAWRRRHPSPLGSAFPYGPALWAGPFIALVLG
ncbi:prepilin peptidase [Propionibacteriaceae bacterium G1746]|uniref:prepilin peptidase n=1 Tax=Aestuariimicrobium sp. G57 TaxID=3418485 RepID=UPI003C222440